MILNDDNDTVQVVSPDGILGTIPKSNLDKALSEGYDLATADDLSVADAVTKNSGLWGATKTFVGQAADELFLGIPEMAADATMDPLEKRKKDAIKEANPVANTLGGIVGGVGSIFNPLVGGLLGRAASTAGKLTTAGATKLIGREAGETVASKIVSKMTGATAKAAGVAAEGATYMAPIATAQNLSNYIQDPDMTAEQLLAGTLTDISVGAGAGVLIGGGLKGLGYLGSAVGGTKAAMAEMLGVRGLSASQALERWSNSTAARAAGVTKGEINNLRKTFGESKYLEKLDDVGAELRARGVVGEGLPKTATGFNSRLNTELQKVGDEISGIYKQADSISNNLAATSDEVAQAVKAIADKRKGSWDPTEINSANILDSFLEKEVAKSQSYGFQELQALKRSVDERINWKAIDADGISKNNALQELSLSLRELLQNKLKGVAPELHTQLRDANTSFHLLKLADNFVGNRLSSELGNTFLGLTGNISAVVPASAAFMGGAGVVGAGVVGAAGAALRKGAQVYGDEAASNLFAGLSRLSRENQKILDSIPSVVGTLKGIERVGNTPGAKILSTKILANLLQEEVPTKDKTEQIKIIGEKLSEATSNPEILMDIVSKQSAPIAEAFPEVAEKYNSKLIESINYINSVVPRPKDTDDFLSSGEWKPSDSEVSSFERAVETILNPYSVVDQLRENTLTKSSVDALEKVYPATYEQIKAKVMEGITEKDTKLPYSTRLKLGTLFKIQVDRSTKPKYLNILQSNFNAEGNNNPNMGMNKPVNLSQNLVTNTQRFNN